MLRPLMDMFDYYKLPIGRLLTVLRRMRAEAVALGAAALLTALDRAIAHTEALYKDELRWRSRKQHRVQHKDEALSLDRELDQLIGGLEGTLALQSKLASAAPERAALAARLYENIFPGGLSAVTQAAFVDQAENTRIIVQTIAGDEAFGQLITELGLAPTVARIAELNERYSELVSAAEHMDFDEIEARRAQAQTLFGEVLARVLGLFPTESEADREAREAFLDPLERQNEVMRAFHKERRRGKPDYDREAFAEADDAEETGEAVDEEDKASGNSGEAPEDERSAA